MPGDRTTPAGRVPALVWPAPDERRLLARFYLALGLSRALYLVAPFEFAYLFLVMERPEWAVLPLVVLSGTSLVMQLPAGVLADRRGRKVTVLAGGALAAVTYSTVPWAVRLEGSAQLIATCSAFGLVGLGLTLMAGAQEAWVVDNLRHAGRDDLVDAFFARTYAVQALGGLLAAVAAVTLLLSASIDRGLLDLLWYTTALGFLAAVAVAGFIEEHPPEHDGAVRAGVWRQTRQVLRVLVTTRPLLLLTVAIMIAALSGAAAEEAFPLSLLTKGFDARGLAPLAIVTDLVGMVAPLVGLVLTRRLGAEGVLARIMVFSGLVVGLLFVTRSVAVVAILYVVLGFADRIWDPVSLARIQDGIPSAHRAALNSVVYQVTSLAELVGLALFGLMLGRHSSALSAATPDLLEAFKGGVTHPTAVPTSSFGLPVPDLAIVVFIAAGLVAVPFVLLARPTSRPPTPRSSSGSGTGGPRRSARTRGPRSPRTGGRAHSSATPHPPTRPRTPPRPTPRSR